MPNEKRRDWIQLRYMTVPRVELSIEAGHHPELCAILFNCAAEDFEVRLAHIAAYCEVAIDGYYTQEEIDKLCDILIDKLRSKRSIIALPMTAKLH